MLEKRDESIVDKVLSVDAHNEVRMSIVLDELHGHLVHVVVLQAVQQQPHVPGVRERVAAAVANEKREVVRDVGEVVHRRARFAIVQHVVVRSAVVVLCQNPISYS